MIDTLEIQKLNADATLPTRAHPEDAGLDLYALEDVVIPAGAGRRVRTGIALAIPAGHVGIVADRSSLAQKGLKTAGGVIDAGYRGEVQVILWNLHAEDQKVARGDRMAQMLILPVATPAVRAVESLDGTQRGAGGFGSTGR